MTKNFENSNQDRETSFTESEMKLIEECKVHGFGAYLQNYWIVYPDLKMELGEGNAIEKNKLDELLNKFKRRKTEFDEIYIHKLSDVPSHCLEEEQKMWISLVPDLNNFINTFEEFLVSYSGSQEELPRLSELIENWWALLQEWNKLSKSYKIKLGKVYDVQFSARRAKNPAEIDGIDE